ncbi:MAG: hypothetical protein ACOCVY_00460 [Patescibacteria group bacterium]
MNDNLKKAFSLAKKTGDRVIVIDSGADSDAFVVMNIDEYEKILSYKETYDQEIKGLTEDQLIDKINRDVALWKSEQQEEEDKERAVSRESRYGDPEEEEEENMYYYCEPEPEPELKFDPIRNYPYSGSEEEAKKDSDSKEKESGEESIEESIFEKFNREQKEYSQEESDESAGKNRLGGNDWKIPFDVKAGADEIKE